MSSFKAIWPAWFKGSRCTVKITHTKRVTYRYGEVLTISISSWVTINKILLASGPGSPAPAGTSKLRCLSQSEKARTVRPWSSKSTPAVKTRLWPILRFLMTIGRFIQVNRKSSFFHSLHIRYKKPQWRRESSKSPWWNCPSRTCSKSSQWYPAV